MFVSIFNDVIGPVMRGPSSSHCAAALRIGRLAHDLMGGEITDVLVQFDRGGSLPTTHASQGSDMGLCGGLLYWSADDDRLLHSEQSLASAGINLRYETIDCHDPHPNTYRLTLTNHHGTRRLVAISTGGGMIEVIELDGVRLSLMGDFHETVLRVEPACIAAVVQRLEQQGFDFVSKYETRDTVLLRAAGQQRISDEQVTQLLAISGVVDVRRLAPVLPVMSRAGLSVPFQACREMLQWDAGRQTPLWQLGLHYEMVRGGLAADDVLEKMLAIVRIWRRSIASGVAGTEFDDRILPAQAPQFQHALQAGKLLDAGTLNRIILYATALMEVKSSMGVIVAAPTAGACAALPGAVIGMAEAMHKSEGEMARAMLAAGMIGVFIATHWSFAAEVGGCQAEGGSAACMAAAALVTLADGTLDQALAAASMALQSMIGLVCDPVGNRVEVPCLGKNVMAASNAVACANMALAGFDQVVPLDEVIETAKRVSQQMPRELRCTGLGGLCLTPTSQRIEQQLANGTPPSLAVSCSACTPAILPTHRLSRE
ncbi:MAG: L-serine ammonia-lyase, iron-sulfur-dependent, subunit alpha [Planctomycetales bacterium]|nr:L-serine ammonia-lyase, iron-sulfur-dependent, subunit alpha [Planctomycetales bacterium]